MKTSKRYLVLIASAVLLLPIYKLVKACGGEIDPYDDYPSFFANTVTNKPMYDPYYYSAWLKYYDDWYGYEGEHATVPDANIKAWQDYMGGKVSEGDVQNFVYNYPYAALKSLYYNLERNEPLGLTQDVASNGMTGWFKESKDLEALGYLMYAKQCEPLVNMGDQWNSPDRDTAKMNKLLRNGLQLQKVAKQEAIRDRFTFQVVRLAFYSGNPRKTLELYNTLVGDKQGSGEIYVRTLALKAGALFRLKRNAEAGYLFSRVFDLSDGQKASAYLSYDWSVEHNIDGVLKLCKTPHEKAVVHLMEGLHHYEFGLDNMKDAYEADPQIEGLDVVMTREINKLEERYQMKVLDRKRGLNGSTGQWGYYYYDAYGAERDQTVDSTSKAEQSHVAPLQAFAQRMISEGKRTDKVFWQLCSSYLYFMSGDLVNSQKQMGIARGGAMTAPQRDLADVLSVVYLIRQSNKIDAAMEAKLLPSLKALQRRRDNKAWRDAMKYILSTAYLQQGDSVKAAFSIANGNMYNVSDYTDLPGEILEALSPAKLQSAQNYLASTKKSEYDRWLTDSLKYSSDDLKELEATHYIRRFEFDAAAKVLSTAHDTAALPDPFVDHVSDMYELEDIDVKKTYTKTTYAKEMAGLAERLKTSPDDAVLLYRYATGIYSISYYGKATYMCTYYRSHTDNLAYFNSKERKAAPAYIQDYYGAITAEQLYVKAAAHTADPELKARALFMAAKCWQKRCEGNNPGYFGDDEDKAYYGNALKSPYFRQLKAGSAGTRFYKEAMGTCGYFADYVKRSK